MAKAPASSSESPVDRLLAERNQYAQWLHRLDVAPESVPEAVRVKVRADYETRLAAVLDALRQHADQVTQQLADHRTRLEELVAKESNAQETLAEAELRHAVGEYDEAQWQKLRGETHRLLVTVREESGKIVEEIARLDEVARLIAAPAAAWAPAPAAPAPAPSPAPAKAKAEPKAAAAPAAPSEPVEEAEAPAPAKGGKAPRESSRTLFFPSGKGAEKGIDELDFLKSVAPEGGAAAGAAPERKASTRAAEAPAKRTSQPTAAVPEPVAEPIPAPVRPEVAKADAGAPKTLKCAECGTMNRPTEWYCERCGAELAAL